MGPELSAIGVSVPIDTDDEKVAPGVTIRWPSIKNGGLFHHRRAASPTEPPSMPESHSDHSPAVDQLPFFTEYLEQVLKPHVSRAIEDVRPHLTEHVWQAIVMALSRDQRIDPNDAAGLRRLRTMLEQMLGLRLAVHLDASFERDGQVSVPATNAMPPQATRVEPVGARASGDAAVVPDNPLARAVSNLRRVNR
jgi:hypothetical protein